eukprot:gnl/TRDRNA2_/TRDRNA2_80773_c0_seq1.p1 gnl/TRDRNA2_/TRDRNA2_80773_c0~~gnl/TRDRNA2_/TRDRNA2_80773_c0_seq1.p1  ORF type:complete len:536 (-),score=98.90 gnl/TRDRNA2_/TRDRNA2_80773_c0_seq1:108-1673(-)
MPAAAAASAKPMVFGQPLPSEASWSPSNSSYGMLPGRFGAESAHRAPEKQSYADEEMGIKPSATLVCSTPAVHKKSSGAPTARVLIYAAVLICSLAQFLIVALSGGSQELIGLSVALCALQAAACLYLARDTSARDLTACAVPDAELVRLFAELAVSVSGAPVAQMMEVANRIEPEDRIAFRRIAAVVEVERLAAAASSTPSSSSRRDELGESRSGSNSSMTVNVYGGCSKSSSKESNAIPGLQALAAITLESCPLQMADNSGSSPRQLVRSAADKAKCIEIGGLTWGFDGTANSCKFQDEQRAASQSLARRYHEDAARLQAALDLELAAIAEEAGGKCMELTSAEPQSPMSDTTVSSQALLDLAFQLGSCSSSPKAKAARAATVLQKSLEEDARTSAQEHDKVVDGAAARLTAAGLKVGDAGAQALAEVGATGALAAGQDGDAGAQALAEGTSVRIDARDGDMAERTAKWEERRVRYVQKRAAASDHNRPRMHVNYGAYIRSQHEQSISGMQSLVPQTTA